MFYPTMRQEIRKRNAMTRYNGDIDRFISVKKNSHNIY